MGVNAAALRPLLLAKVRDRIIPSHLYTARFWGLRSDVMSALSRSSKFVGGCYFDRRRERAEPCGPKLILPLVRSVVDVCIGPVFRVSQEEAQYLVTDSAGDYGVGVPNPISDHARH